MNQNPHWKQLIWTWASIIFGNALYSLAVALFLEPAGLITGGATGIALAIGRLTGLSVSGLLFFINLAMLVWGWVVLGRAFALNTLASSVLSPAFLALFEGMANGRVLTEDIFLCTVFAGLGIGVSLGIVIRSGASTGGTDIVALILAKYTSMEIGKALMASDILIVLAAAWRFGMGTGLYCILGLIGKSFVVDGAIENIRLRKVCTIMTANPQPILDFIIKDMNRSATVEKAYGAYTHHELSVLVTVLTRRQALQLRNFLRENDPRSFITIVNSSEIIGKGFRSFN